MKFKILFLLLFFCIEAFSQYEYKRGFIIKKDGTQEEGLIKVKSSGYNAKKCKFQKDEKTHPRVYLPGEIAGYHLIDSKYFESKNVFINDVQRDVFLECLISGVASVYYTVLNTADHFYLGKEGKLVEIDNNKVDIIKGGVNYEVPSNQYKKILNESFKDCPPVIQKLDSVDFSKKSLITLSKEYNEYVCPDVQCIIYEKNIQKTRFSFGLDFSYGMTKINYAQNFGNISMPPTNNFQFNINSQIELDETGTINLLLSLGYYYYKNELLNNKTFLAEVSTPNDVFYKFSILRPSVQLKYKFHGKKLTPFISGGIFSSIFLLDKGELYSHNFEIWVPFTSGGQHTKSSMNGMMGGIVNIGLESKLKPGTLLFSFYYEPYFTNPMKTSYNMGLRLGYNFNFKRSKT
jgi:hypothetical protein